MAVEIFWLQKMDAEDEGEKINKKFLIIATAQMLVKWKFRSFVSDMREFDEYC